MAGGGIGTPMDSPNLQLDGSPQFQAAGTPIVGGDGGDGGVPASAMTSLPLSMPSKDIISPNMTGGLDSAVPASAMTSLPLTMPGKEAFTPAGGSPLDGTQPGAGIPGTSLTGIPSWLGGWTGATYGSGGGTGGSTGGNPFSYSTFTPGAASSSYAAPRAVSNYQPYSKPSSNSGETSKSGESGIPEVWNNNSGNGENNGTSNAPTMTEAQRRMQQWFEQNQLNQQAAYLNSIGGN